MQGWESGTCIFTIYRLQNQNEVKLGRMSLSVILTSQQCNTIFCLFWNTILVWHVTWIPFLSCQKYGLYKRRTGTFCCCWFILLPRGSYIFAVHIFLQDNLNITLVHSREENGADEYVFLNFVSRALRVSLTRRVFPTIKSALPRSHFGLNHWQEETR